MLDGIRRNARSWAVKAMFGIIVLVFVFWGVGGFQGNEKNILATVNDKPIHAKQFYRFYDQELNRLRQRNPDISTADLKDMDFKRQLFNQLVNKRLLLDKVKELGILVSTEELKNEISSMKVFQDENNQFDVKRYQAVLQANNIDPARFEAGLQSDLLVQKLRSYILSPVKVNENEARELFNYIQEKAKIEYILFSSKDYMDQVNVSDKEIKKYYEQHQEDFREKERIKIEYLLLTPDALSPFQEVQSEEIKEYYEQHQEQFKIKDKSKQGIKPLEEVHSQIKTQIAKNKAADNLENFLDQTLDIIFSTGDMSKAAEQVDIRLRESDYFSKDEGLKEVDLDSDELNTLFSLKQGEITDTPIILENGYLLAKKVKEKPSHIKSLKKVQEQVVKQLQKEKAQELAQRDCENTLSQLQKGEKLSPEVKKRIKTSQSFSRRGYIPGLGFNANLAKDIFDLEKQEWLPQSYKVDLGYVLARLEKKIPPSSKQWEEQKSFWTSNLQNQRGEEIFQAFVQGLRQEAEIEINNPEMLSYSS